MAALSACMDKHTPKAVGENGNVEYTWSHDIKERIMQLHFQLVRCTERGEELGNTYLEILNEILQHKENDELFGIAIRLPAITRDLTTKASGKGEWHLAYILTERLIRVFPEVGMKLFRYFCMEIPSPSSGSEPATDSQDTTHPYGSWKDVKYFWRYVHNKSTEIADYRFTDYNTYFINLVNNQLRTDMNSDHPTLLARWIARETSQFGWQFKLLAENFFHRYLDTAKYSKKENAMELAKKKAYMDYSKIITSISKEKLDTPQVKMCAKNWRGINIERLTSVTLRKQSRPLANTTKSGEQRSEDPDRIECAHNFSTFVGRVKEGKVVAKGKRVGIVDFVSDAIELNNLSGPDTIAQQIDLLNGQWNDFVSEIGELNVPMICMLDTSGSMGELGPKNGQNTPLLAAIGLSCVISQKSSIKDRVMTFSASPRWINLNGVTTFEQRVQYLSYKEWGFNTDFYAAMDLLLECAVENKIPAEKWKRW